MQAVILSAGEGKRLRPLSAKVPKCFLKIKGKPIIEYQLEYLRKEGIKDIIIVVGYKAKFIKRKLQNRSIKFVLNPFYKKTNVLTSLWFAKDKLKNSFVFMHADTIFEEGIFRKMMAKRADIVLPVDLKECNEEDMKVMIEKEKIKKISKEIPLNKAAGEFVGIAKVSKRVLPRLKLILDEFMYRGEFNHFFEEAIQKMLDERKYKIDYIQTNGMFWNEIDFYEDLCWARKHF